MQSATIGRTVVQLQGGIIAAKEYRDAFQRSLTEDAYSILNGASDMDIVMRIGWAMAKTADRTIPPYTTWAPRVLSDEVIPEPDCAYDNPLSFTENGGREIVQAVMAEIFRLEKTEPTEEQPKRGSRKK